MVNSGVKMALFDGDILEPVSAFVYAPVCDTLYYILVLLFFFNFQGLKFLQLKSYQLTNANDANSGQCFAIDQRNQVVFACCRNELIFVPFNSLLNFEAWTKELLKKVEAQIPGKVAVKVGSESLNCHLVSISSRGYGSKLALCSYDQGSLFITFYDLKSLYQNREKVCCLLFDLQQFQIFSLFFHFRPFHIVVSTSPGSLDTHLKC